MINQADKSWRVKIRIEGETLYGLVDTGAGRTLLSRKKFAKLRTEPTNARLQGAGGSAIKVYGATTIPITMGDVSYPTNVLVAEIGTDVLLGYDFLHDNNFAVVCGEGMLCNDLVTQPMTNEPTTTTSCYRVKSHNAQQPTPPEPETDAAADGNPRVDRPVAIPTPSGSRNSSMGDHHATTQSDVPDDATTQSDVPDDADVSYDSDVIPDIPEPPLRRTGRATRRPRRLDSDEWQLT